MIHRVHAVNTRKSLSIPFRDLADGMRQQMYLWGRDALHQDGNLFVRTGFTKRPSEGLQGTSCYALPWQSGRIELHGSHAGWFGEDGGFLFIRPLGRCVRWRSATSPVPGEWDAGHIDARADESLHSLSVPFLNWWLTHEAHVECLAGSAYREACLRQFKKLPKSRPWLPSAAATRWITGLRDEPHSLPRARRFSTTPANA